MDVQQERALFDLTVERVERIREGSLQRAQAPRVEAQRQRAEVDLQHPSAAAMAFDTTEAALREGTTSLAHAA